MFGLHKMIGLVMAVMVFLSHLPLEYEGSAYKMGPDLKEQIKSTQSQYVALKDIDEDLVNFTVLSEDKRFYSHEGFDLVSIGRALLLDIKKGELHSGGSTITQQLAKNLFLSGDKKLSRKLRELVLAIKLEMAYSKEDILEMYLNVIYFGEGAYGISAATQTYFNKSSSVLSEEEAATLVGLLPAPSYYNPIVNQKLSIQKRDSVLRLVQ